MSVSVVPGTMLGDHARLYALLRSDAVVTAKVETAILSLFTPQDVESLRSYSAVRERRWSALRKGMTFAWAGRHLASLAGRKTMPPLLAELLARSFDYRMGPYDCLLNAEDALSVPHLVRRKPASTICRSVVVLLEFWKRIAPVASNLTAIYRVEDRPRGWALQWQEGRRICSPNHGLEAFDIDRCGKRLLRAGRTLTVNSTITFAGDRNRGSFVNKISKELDPGGVPWIWTWRRPAEHSYLRFRVLPPRGSTDIVNAVPMHFNTMRIQHAYERKRTGPGWLRNRREFGFDDPSFNISAYVPRLDYNEVVLKPGSRMVVDDVHVDGLLITATLRQLE